MCDLRKEADVEVGHLSGDNSKTRLKHNKKEAVHGRYKL
jgi:hypothetical protein